MGWLSRLLGKKRTDSLGHSTRSAGSSLSAAPLKHVVREFRCAVKSDENILEPDTNCSLRIREDDPAVWGGTLVVKHWSFLLKAPGDCLLDLRGGKTYPIHLGRASNDEKTIEFSGNAPFDLEDLEDKVPDAQKGASKTSEGQQTPCVREDIRNALEDALVRTPLETGTEPELRKGQMDFNTWGDGVWIGSQSWLLERFGAHLSVLNLGGLRVSRDDDYGWQRSVLKPFCLRIVGNLPNGMLAGFYLGKLGEDRYGAFGYGINEDAGEPSPSQP